MKNNLSALFFAILLLLLLLSSLYIFNIYEVDFRYPESVATHSKFQVLLVPLNSLGYKAPLRSVNYAVSFVEGEDLVEIDDNHKGLIQFSSEERTGLVKLLITTNKSLAPAVIEIQIKNR